MRKYILGAAALLSGIAVAQGQKFVASQELPASQEVVSFAILSDLHFENNVGAGAAVKVPRALKSISSKKPLDAIFFVGDMTNGGTMEQFRMFNSAVNQRRNYVYPIENKVFMMGNHDNYDSKGQSNYAQVLSPDKNYPMDQYLVINGIPFITISQRSGGNNDGYNLSEGERAYPKEVCDKVAGWMEQASNDFPGKPIFVFTHVPPTYTAYSSWYGEGDTPSPNWSMRPVGAVLARYPQAIIFSGHSHYPLGDPRSIHQGVSPSSSKNNYYTAVGTGSTTYSEIEGGKVDEGIHPTGYTDVTEGLIVTVLKNGDVEIRRYDTFRDEEIGADNRWVVRAPHDGSMFEYADVRDSLDIAPDQRFRTGLPAPEWTPVDAVAVTSEDGTVTVTYPQATDDECVFRYHIMIKDASGRVMASRWDFSQFFLGSDMPSSLSAKFPGLHPDKTYTVEIRAYDSYDNESSGCLTAQFDVPAGQADPVPQASGRWTFDDASDLFSNSIEGSPLAVQPINVAGHNVTLADAGGIASVAGPGSDNGAVRLSADTGLQVTRGTRDRCTGYTLMYDIRVKDFSQWHALLQTNAANSDDADFFINRDAQIGIGVGGCGYAGKLKADTWHRVVIAVDGLVPSIYIDGELVKTSAVTDDRWALGDDRFYLFCDDDGENDEIDVAGFAYWNQPLTSRQVREMGGATGTGGLETSTPAINVIDGDLQFDVLVTSKADPVFELPEWIEAVNTYPMPGTDIPYTFRCKELEAGGERAGNIRVSCPSCAGVDPIVIEVRQVNRGDVLNEKKWGEWNFSDAGDLLHNEVVSSPISLSAGSEGSRSFKAGTPEVCGISLIDGPSDSNPYAIHLPKNAALKINNGTEHEIDTYSYMLEVRIKDIGWHSVFSSTVANDVDADLFIRDDGSIGIRSDFLGYGGNVSLDEWHKIVVVVTDGAPSIYVDGKLAVQGKVGSTRWNIKGDGALFFADEDGEDNPIDVARIVIWSDFLTPGQVAGL